MNNVDTIDLTTSKSLLVTEPTKHAKKHKEISATSVHKTLNDWKVTLFSISTYTLRQKVQGEFNAQICEKINKLSNTVVENQKKNKELSERHKLAMEVLQESAMNTKEDIDSEFKVVNSKLDKIYHYGEGLLSSLGFKRGQQKSVILPTIECDWDNLPPIVAMKKQLADSQKEIRELVHGNDYIIDSYEAQLERMLVNHQKLADKVQCYEEKFVNYEKTFQQYQEKINRYEDIFEELKSQNDMFATMLNQYKEKTAEMSEKISTLCDKQ
jgi:chromosome segregation ATPase